MFHDCANLVICIGAAKIFLWLNRSAVDIVFIANGTIVTKLSEFLKIQIFNVRLNQDLLMGMIN